MEKKNLKKVNNAPKTEKKAAPRFQKNTEELRKQLFENKYHFKISENGKQIFCNKIAEDGTKSDITLNLVGPDMWNINAKVFNVIPAKSEKEKPTMALKNSNFFRSFSTKSAKDIIRLYA